MIIAVCFISSHYVYIKYKAFLLIVYCF